MAAPTRRGVRWEEPCCRRRGLLGGSGSVRAGEGRLPSVGTAQGRAGRNPAVRVNGVRGRLTAVGKGRSWRAVGFKTEGGR